MRIVTTTLSAAMLFTLAACGDTTLERSLTGGAGGAAGGAIIGALAGSAGLGAAAGAGAGLIGGYLYDQYEKGNINF